MSKYFLSVTINFVKGNEHKIEPWLTSRKWDAAGDPRTIIVTCTTLEENKFRCENDPCGNNGECYGGVSSFYCDCSIGWTGKLCAIPGNLLNNPQSYETFNLSFFFSTVQFRSL